MRDREKKNKVGIKRDGKRIVSIARGRKKGWRERRACFCSRSTSSLRSKQRDVEIPGEKRSDGEMRRIAAETL